jgi:hypothetical protein
MLVIAAAGLLLLQTYRAMLHQSPAAPKPSPPSGGEGAASGPGRDFGAETETVADAFLRPGAWALGNNNWSMAMIDMSGPADEARLQSLGSRTMGDAKPSALEEKLLVWLRQFRPETVNGCRVYNARIGSLRVRAVTEKREEQERLRLVQAVWRQRAATRLLEASPAPTSGAQETRDGHLLPLPNGVASMARRWDDSGRLSCEILGPASAKECVREWSAAGWTTEKIGEEQGPISLVKLRKDGRVIQLFPLEAGPSGSPTYLLLMAQSAKQ